MADKSDVREPEAPEAGMEGSWLYKQHELLLGPVSSDAVVEMLFAGQIDGATPLSPHESPPSFKPLSEYPAFRVSLAKAEAKLKVEAQHREVVGTRRRGRRLRLAASIAVAAGLCFGLGKAAIWIAQERPWERRIEIPEPTITDELPIIALASGRAQEEEGIDYPFGDEASARAEKGKERVRGRKGAAGRKPSAGKAVASRTGEKIKTDSDGLASEENWDADAIQQILASKKKTLHPCLAAEARRQKSGWGARIPIEFTVGNDGRVTKLWIDHHEFKSEGCDLHRCMFEALSKWQFPKYEGEQANINMAFNVHAG